MMCGQDDGNCCVVRMRGVLVCIHHLSKHPSRNNTPPPTDTLIYTSYTHSGGVLGTI